MLFVLRRAFALMPERTWARIGRSGALGALAVALCLWPSPQRLCADAVDAADSAKANKKKTGSAGFARTWAGATVPRDAPHDVPADVPAGARDLTEAEAAVDATACRAVATEAARPWRHAPELDALLTIEPGLNVRTHARRRGLSDVWLKRVHGKDVSSVQRLLERLSAEADTRLHIACDSKGRTGGPPPAQACICIVSPRGGSLRVEGGAIRAALATGFAEPELWLDDHTGVPEQVPLSALEHVNQSPDVCQIQLTARGPQGRRPVAELDIKPGGCSNPRYAFAKTLGILSESTETGSLSSPALIATFLNAERRRLRAGPLRLHRKLGVAASLRATAVASSQYPTHRSASGPHDVAHALTQERLRTLGHAETVACGFSRREALRALMQSPAHRAQLLAQPFSHVGVAEAQASQHGRLCLVLILARYPRAH